MTFLTDRPVVAYRRVFNAGTNGQALINAETDFAAYLLAGVSPHALMTVLCTLAREGISHEALRRAGELPPEIVAQLPAADPREIGPA